MSGALVATIVKATTPKLTSSPTTSSPTKRPSSSPVTPYPTTGKPTLELIEEVMLSTSTNVQAVREATSKPSLRHTANTNDIQAGVPSVHSETAEDTKPSAASFLSAAYDRPRQYCFARTDSLDRDCPLAMECSYDSPCPSGQVCLQHDCEGRPESNGDLDLCPHLYVGVHSSDCEAYYECDVHGYVGPTRVCEDGHKFDKTSGRCMLGHLVDSQCVGIESLVAPNQRPTTSEPTSEQRSSFMRPQTLKPTDARIEEEATATANDMEDLVEVSPRDDRMNSSHESNEDTPRVSISKVSQATSLLDLLKMKESLHSGSPSESPTELSEEPIPPGGEEWRSEYWFTGGGHRRSTSGIEPVRAQTALQVAFVSFILSWRGLG